MPDNHGLYHLHRRKRAHDKSKKLEPYPHPHRFKAFIDHTVYCIGVIGPLLGGVQAYKIWSTQDARGVSLSLFGFNIIFNIIWIMYGVIHKEKPLILMYSLWFIMNTLVTVGALLYG